MVFPNSFVCPLFTDFYQISMVYAYWKSKRHLLNSSFDLFFRKNPFKGEFTIFAGLSQVLSFLKNFKVSDAHIEYLKKRMPNSDPSFFKWFQEEMNLNDVVIYAPLEGTVMFSKVPLLKVEGPLAICQLLETTLLNLINFASLVATNAARYRILCGEDKNLLEFGLRRAQGPDGAMSASIYSYIGGFDGSSNVMAGLLYDIPISGTHAHAFVSSFSSLKDIEHCKGNIIGTSKIPFYDMCMSNMNELGYDNTNKGELAAFIDYAHCFPNSFLALVDTYSTVDSGIPNFLIVALSLIECGFRPIGIRLDSGDLAYLSKFARQKFVELDKKMFEINTKDILVDFKFENLTIVASNDLNENTISAIQLQEHSIDTFGIGTNIVTCQSQPALGCVYKLVEIDGIPRLKLSQEIEKVSIPNRKECFRLIGKTGIALLDYMTINNVEYPEVNKKVLCRHPFITNKRSYVTPTEVLPLHVCVWKKGEIQKESGFDRSLDEIKNYVQKQLSLIREDILRIVNPTPYKVSVSCSLHENFYELWNNESAVSELT